jgi:hypothetical protein
MVLEVVVHMGVGHVAHANERPEMPHKQRTL